MARKEPITQRERTFAFLKAKGMARLSELIGEGVTASTVLRLEREGAIICLARGLYQLADASIYANHTLAEQFERLGFSPLSVAGAFFQGRLFSLASGNVNMYICAKAHCLLYWVTEQIWKDLAHEPTVY